MAASLPAPAQAAEEPKPSNIPPTASPADLQRYLQVAKQNLAASLQRKKDMDRDLANIESSLYGQETAYLSGSAGNEAAGLMTSGLSFGNVVKGYDSYLKAPSTLGASSAGERKRNRASMYGGAPDINAEDRIFSNSSETFMRSLEMREQGIASATSDDDSAAQTTSRTKRRR